jgi:hypothetical protein
VVEVVLIPLSVAFCRLQRKQTAQLSLIRKHRLKDAMEMMRVTNKYQDLDQLLGYAIHSLMVASAVRTHTVFLSVEAIVD